MMISLKWMLVVFLMIQISMDSACAYNALSEDVYDDLEDDDDDVEPEMDCIYEEVAAQCPESISPAIPIFADSDIKAPTAAAHPADNLDDFYFDEDYDSETDSPCQQSGLQCPEGTEIPTLADSELTASAAATYPDIIIDSASEPSSPCKQDGLQCPEGSIPSNIPILPDFELPSPKTVRYRVVLFGVLSWIVFMASILLLPRHISKCLRSRRRFTQNEDCEMV